MRWTVLALVACAAALGAGCGSSDKGGTTGGGATTTTASSAGRTYAFADYTDANPVLKGTTDEFERQANDLGISFKRYDNKADPNNTLAVARLMAQAKPDVAIDWAIQPQLAGSLGRVFSQANVPCIALSAPIDGCGYFLLDNADAGTQEARAAIPIAKQRGFDGSNTTVVMITIPGGGDDLNGGPRGFYATYARAFPEMKQFDGPTSITDDDVRIGDFNGYQVAGGDSLQHAYDAVLKALQVIPSDRNIVLVALNDDAARGGLRALQRSNRDDRAMVVSQGADADSLTALRAGGPWAVEGDPALKLWAAYVYAMADAMLATGKVAKEESVAPIAILTADNVDKFYAGSKLKQAPPVPPQNEYLQQYNLDKYVKVALGG